MGAITSRMAPVSKIQFFGIMPWHLKALDVLPFHQHHRDPFDHMIIAQSISEGMTLVTQDWNARVYPVRILPP